MHEAATLPPSRDEIQSLAEHGLYRPGAEHDACGVGFVAHIKGTKAHSIIEQGLKILENLDHRGAVGADKLMGDGAGILIQLPDDFPLLSPVALFRSTILPRWAAAAARAP